MTETDNSHKVRSILIGAPLLLALVFSFGFIMVRPLPANQTRSAASRNPKASHADKAPASFSPESQAPANLPLLSQAPANDGSTTGAPGKTAAPQIAAGSTPRNSANPQTNSARGQSISATESISVKVNLPVPALTNLAH